MPNGPAEAARLIHTVIEITSPPTSTRQVLVDIIQKSGWHFGTDAEDKADLWLNRFISRLERLIEDSRDNGSFLEFAFNSSGTDFIQGYCFSEPHDSSDIIAHKQNRAKTRAIYDHCQRLSATDFENLSGKVLDLLNVEKAYVSRRSADQGIDFFGRVNFGDMIKSTLLDPGAEKHFYVWLVGQSKHYPQSKVSTKEIRELVGSVEFARAKIFAGSSDPLADLEVRLCDPIFFLFFTTGKFTRDSYDILGRSGVLSFDGLQIAQFLADRGVGLIAGDFDPSSFDHWLRA